MVTTTPVAFATAGLALLGAVAVGIVAHESMHAIVLRAAGVPAEIRWLPKRHTDGSNRRTAWATVKPVVESGAASPLVLRIAALAPLAMAAPLALGLLGVVPNPFADGPPVAQAALVGWLGCALPSPRDFAVVWYAEQALARTSKSGDPIDSA